jgi:hypothetical protein
LFPSFLYLSSVPPTLLFFSPLLPSYAFPFLFPSFLQILIQKCKTGQLANNRIRSVSWFQFPFHRMHSQRDNWGTNRAL